MKSLRRASSEQDQRNLSLITSTPFVGERFESRVLPFRLDLKPGELGQQECVTLSALEKRAASIAIKSGRQPWCFQVCSGKSETMSSQKVPARVPLMTRRA